MGDARSEREHEFVEGPGVTEGVVDGRVFRQATEWLRVSLTVYDDTEVTLTGTFRGTAGATVAFELLVEQRQVKVRPLVSPSTTPVSVEFPIPMALTKGKTRICVEIRAVTGPTPGLIELRTVQEHLELSPAIHWHSDELVSSGPGAERATRPGRENPQPLWRVEALR